MSRPRMIPLGRNLLPGAIAVALFAVLAATFLTVAGSGPTEFAFTDPPGFPDVSIVAGIGYALIGEPAAAGAELVYESTESFLVALVIVALLLDAALDGALMLAERDEGDEQ